MHEGDWQQCQIIHTLQHKRSWHLHVIVILNLKEHHHCYYSRTHVDTPWEGSNYSWASTLLQPKGDSSHKRAISIKWVWLTQGPYQFMCIVQVIMGVLHHPPNPLPTGQIVMVWFCDDYADDTKHDRRRKLTNHHCNTWPCMGNVCEGIQKGAYNYYMICHKWRCTGVGVYTQVIAVSFDDTQQEHYSIVISYGRCPNLINRTGPLLPPIHEIWNCSLCKATHYLDKLNWRFVASTKLTFPISLTDACMHWRNSE